MTFDRRKYGRFSPKKWNTAFHRRIAEIHRENEKNLVNLRVLLIFICFTICKFPFTINQFSVNIARYGNKTLSLV